MKTKKYKVHLNQEERSELESIVDQGRHLASTIKRANILLNLDENNGTVDQQSDIAKRLNTTTTTIYNVSKQFCKEGFYATMTRKQRLTPPIQPIVTGEIEAKILALACSEAPEGYTRWTLRLLEKKVVELEIVKAISDNTIQRTLKKHHLSLI